MWILLRPAQCINIFYMMLFTVSPVFFAFVFNLRTLYFMNPCLIVIANAISASKKEMGMPHAGNGNDTNCIPMPERISASIIQPY